MPRWVDYDMHARVQDLHFIPYFNKGWLNVFHIPETRSEEYKHYEINLALTRRFRSIAGGLDTKYHSYYKSFNQHF